jgi:ABC-type sugar transport system substrate-binding protein
VIKRSLAIIAMMTALTTAGCSAAADSSTTAVPTSPSTGASVVPYDGPDAAFFAAMAEPTVKKGFDFKLGFLNASSAFPSLLAQQAAACKAAEDLGGSCVVFDAESNPQKQVSQFDSLLAQGVSAIVVQPSNPDALAPSLAQAAKQGIPVIAGDTPADTSSAPLANLVAQVSQLSDYGSYQTATAVAGMKPGAHFAVLGTALPIPILKFIVARTKYWAEKQGLIFDGQVDATAQTPAAWSAAANTIGQKYPEVTVVFSFNDSSALAAVNTLKAGGRADIVVADANGFTSLAQAAIKDGSMIASFAQAWDEKGRYLALAAYAAATGQHVPAIIGVKGVLVTSKNVDGVVPIG